MRVIGTPVRSFVVEFMTGSHSGAVIRDELAVDSNDPSKIELPMSGLRHAFAFRFHAVINVEVEEDGETHLLTGGKKSESTTYYIGGTVVTLEEAKTFTHPITDLADFMKRRGWQRAIYTSGGVHEFKDADVLLPEAS